MSPTPAICFDNSGTLCETVVRETAHTDDDVWRRPVPDVPLEAGRAALLSLDHGGVDCLDRDGSLGAALRDADVPLHLALSNTDIDTEQAAAVVRGASEIPLSLIHI